MMMKQTFGTLEKEDLDLGMEGRDLLEGGGCGAEVVEEGEAVCMWVPSRGNQIMVTPAKSVQGK